MRLNASRAAAEGTEERNLSQCANSRSDRAAIISETNTFHEALPEEAKEQVDYNGGDRNDIMVGLLRQSTKATAHREKMGTAGQLLMLDVEIFRAPWRRAADRGDTHSPTGTGTPKQDPGTRERAA